jgi:hypothetical protein
MKQRRLTLILIFCVCVNFGFSQIAEISNLDTKYGLNKFKLEDSYIKYKNQTKLVEFGSTKKDTKEYDYTGKDIEKILDHSVRNIKLIFIKEKLSSIHVFFNNNLTDYQNNRIYEKLVALFGTPSASNPPGMYGSKFTYSWITYKTQLLFAQPEGYGSQMMISSRILLMERDNDEF